MFTEIHLIRQPNKAEMKKYRDRWSTAEGDSAQEGIIEALRTEGTEDSLKKAKEKQAGNITEGHRDLKGISIIEKEIVFKKEPADLENVDFSYASLRNTRFENVIFVNVNFNSADLFGCEFINCEFIFTNFYACYVEKTVFLNCDFIINNTITNCVFRETLMEKYFTPENFLFDCKFDEITSISEPLLKPNREENTGSSLDKMALAEIYKGIKLSYNEGNVTKKSRDYFFKERGAITRYNTSGLIDRIVGYLVEAIAGYGVRPIRVFITTVLIFLAYSGIFVHEFGLRQGMLISAGAFCTFGSSGNFLASAPYWVEMVYILESFTGISMMALFVTVLVNLLFKER
jgi:hypothetical protein